MKAYANSIGLKLSSLALVLRRDVEGALRSGRTADALEAADEVVLAIQRARVVYDGTASLLTSDRRSVMEEAESQALKSRIADIVEGAGEMANEIAAMSDALSTMTVARDLHLHVANDVVGRLAVAMTSLVLIVREAGSDAAAIASTPSLQGRRAGSPDVRTA